MSSRDDRERERHRRHYARQRHGVSCFTIALPGLDVAEWLIQQGVLDPDDADRHNAVTAALQRAVMTLIRAARPI